MQSPARVWLARVCEIVPGTAEAVLLLGADSVSRDPVASWPDGAAPGAELVAAAVAAHEHQRPVAAKKSAPVPKGASVDAREEAPRVGHVAVPFQLSSGARGAVALRIVGSEWDARGVAARVGAALAWLDPLIAARSGRERVVTVLDLVGAALEHESLSEALGSVATEIATRLGMERVSLGFVVRDRTRVEAISHSQNFDERTQLVQSLGKVMDEATDQDASVVFPPAAGANRITRAHERFSKENGVASLLTVPLAAFGEIVGAVCFEAGGDALDASRVELCEDASALLGPLLHTRRLAERGWRERLRASFRGFRERLAGPGHAELKLGVGVVAGLLLVLLLVPMQHRASADAVLEGRIRRAIVAGVDGYIGEANARAGDLVKQGQALGRLDDRDLVLERQKWVSQLEQLRTEQRGALALRDRTQLNVLSAKQGQAVAQIDLLDEQLGRTRLVAPFDGVVVRGDLSQSLGSPVSRGDVLFEVAPLDGYRIILEVEERDVRQVTAGHSGNLRLAALPGRSLPLTVERITPVAIARDGGNYFRAEARLDLPVDSLRPGMEGVARIELGRRPLLWIWTRQIVDAMGFWIWSWRP